MSRSRSFCKSLPLAIIVGLRLCLGSARALSGFVDDTVVVLCVRSGHVAHHTDRHTGRVDHNQLLNRPASAEWLWVLSDGWCWVWSWVVGARWVSVVLEREGEHAVESAENSCKQVTSRWGSHHPDAITISVAIITHHARSQSRYLSLSSLHNTSSTCPTHGSTLPRSSRRQTRQS